MEKRIPLVVIVLVNYNGFDDTYECVESILKNDYSNYRIVVVDNASNENEKDRLKSNSLINESCTVIYNEDNLGFSNGNNLGIKYANSINAEYVLLLNNDTIVTESFLTQLIYCADSNQDASIVTGSIMYYRNPTNYWYAGGEYDYNTGVTSMLKYKDESEAGYKSVSFATGCLMLIKSNYIKKYGNLDESFFLYSEDTEFCLRALKNKTKIYWNPRAIIYHKVNASTGKNSLLQQYYLTRNNLMIISDYSTNKIKSKLLLFWFCMKQVLKGRYNIKPIVHAYWDYHRGFVGKSERY